MTDQHSQPLTARLWLAYVRPTGFDERTSYAVAAHTKEEAEARVRASLSDGTSSFNITYEIIEVLPVKDMWRNAIPVYRSAGLGPDGIERSRPVEKDTWTET